MWLSALLLGFSKSVARDPPSVQSTPPLHTVSPSWDSPGSLLLLKPFLCGLPTKHTLLHHLHHLHHLQAHQHSTHLNHLSDKTYMNDLPRCRLQAKCTVFPPFPEGWSFLISPQSLGSCCGSILYYIIFPLHSSPSDFSIFSKILLKWLPGNPVSSAAASWLQRKAVKFILHLPKSSCNLPLGKEIKLLSAQDLVCSNKKTELGTILQVFIKH